VDVPYPEYEYVLASGFTYLSSSVNGTYLPFTADDGHDTSVTVAGKWLRGFITPLLNNSNFMQKTLILLSKCS